MKDDIDPSARILIVDDEPAMQEMMVGYLEGFNLRAVPASGREQAASRFAECEPDLVILDLQLGRQDGLDLLREIRSHSDVPVVIVTGRRCDEIDRVVGLGLGADDYVTKPFSLGELLARIRAILRRRGIVSAPTQPDREARRCQFDGWRLDRRDRRLTDPNGVRVALTKGEYALLIAFLDAPQRPLSREHLLQATCMHEDIFDRSIDVQVLRLRRKLERDPSAPRLIRTERGVGYVFAPLVERI
jgi:two-component system, OmpR family, response regulator